MFDNKHRNINSRYFRAFFFFKGSVQIWYWYHTFFWNFLPPPPFHTPPLLSPPLWYHTFDGEKYIFFATYNCVLHPCSKVMPHWFWWVLECFIIFCCVHLYTIGNLFQFLINSYGLFAYALNIDRMVPIWKT